MVSPQPAVFLFLGTDTYSKEKAIHDLGVSVLGNASPDLDRRVFRGSQSSAREILDQVSTVPFLAPQRLVVVKEFEKLPDEDRARIVAYAGKPSKTACLILDARDTDVLKEFSDHVRSMGVKTFAEPVGQDLAAWIRQFAAAKGKKIEPAAIALLKEGGHGSLARLAQELEKLSAFVGQRDTIQPADVEEVTGKSPVASVFDLSNAIEAKKVDQALRVVHDLVAGGKKHYEVIGLLVWHVKRLLRAKTLQAKGATDTYIATNLKINQKYFGKFFRQVKALRMDAIKAEMRVLLEADLDIKRSRLEPMLALECAVIRLCLGG